MDDHLKIMMPDMEIEVDASDLTAHRKLLADQIRERFGGIKGHEWVIEEIADWLDS